jgi:hypothetical protein
MINTSTKLRFLNGAFRYLRKIDDGLLVLRVKLKIGDFLERHRGNRRLKLLKDRKEKRYRCCLEEVGIREEKKKSADIGRQKPRG